MRAVTTALLLAVASFSAHAAEDAHDGHHGMHHGHHGKIQHEAPDPHAGHDKSQPSQSYTPVPEPTDEERAAAFPKLGDMHMQHVMDSPVMFYALLDQFEWVDADEGSAYAWEAMGWWGKDEHRLWWRTEGETHDGETGDAELQLLYGRPFARWWDWVAGVRHDFRPEPSQSWLALGVQGLAPYWFETEATLFLGEGGQSNLRLEVEYELLLTQRLVLQPLLELNLFGKDDAERGIGSGLSTAEAGLRLRYEIRREIAPYIGIRWERAYGETADLVRQADGEIDESALVAGIRLWY